MPEYFIPDTAWQEPSVLLPQNFKPEVEPHAPQLSEEELKREQRRQEYEEFAGLCEQDANCRKAAQEFVGYLEADPSILHLQLAEVVPQLTLEQKNLIIEHILTGEGKQQFIELAHKALGKVFNRGVGLSALAFIGEVGIKVILKEVIDAYFGQNPTVYFGISMAASVVEELVVERHELRKEIDVDSVITSLDNEKDHVKLAALLKKTEEFLQDNASTKEILGMERWSELARLKDVFEFHRLRLIKESRELQGPWENNGDKILFLLGESRKIFESRQGEDQAELVELMEKVELAEKTVVVNKKKVIQTIFNGLIKGAISSAFGYVMADTVRDQVQKLVGQAFRVVGVEEGAKDVVSDVSVERGFERAASSLFDRSRAIIWQLLNR